MNLVATSFNAQWWNFKIKTRLAVLPSSKGKPETVLCGLVNQTYVTRDVDDTWNSLCENPTRSRNMTLSDVAESSWRNIIITAVNLSSPVMRCRHGTASLLAGVWLRVKWRSRQLLDKTQHERIGRRRRLPPKTINSIIYTPCPEKKSYVNNFNKCKCIFTILVHIPMIRFAKNV